MALRDGWYTLVKAYSDDFMMGRKLYECYLQTVRGGFCCQYLLHRVVVILHPQPSLELLAMEKEANPYQMFLSNVLVQVCGYICMYLRYPENSHTNTLQ